MKQIPYLLTFLFLTACSTPPKENNAKGDTDPTKIKNVATEQPAEESKPKKTLYLNGIYEYDYPHDTEEWNENQYIAFKKDADTLRAWYYGTSDEFDEAREGYLPGYFVAAIEDLTTKGDSLFFSVTTGYNQCYSDRFPVGYVDENELNEKFEKWFVSGEAQTINYSGKLDGLNLYIQMFGETRTYRKSQNHFHIGIDNYDPTKCQSGALLIVDKNMNNLNEYMVFSFLKTFSVICEANVEFGEWSNELLFKALSKHPALVLKILSDNSNELDMASILSELESPLHDLIPIDSITAKIESLEVEERIKNLVLKRLENVK